MITLHNTDLLQDALKWLVKAQAEGIHESCAMPNSLPMTIAHLTNILDNYKANRKTD